MRRDFFDIRTFLFGFYSTSRRCIPRLSPRNSNLDEVTANNGAAENRSGCHGSCYFTFGSLSFEPPSLVACMRFLRSALAATAPASAVSELESFGVLLVSRRATVRFSFSANAGPTFPATDPSPSLSAPAKFNATTRQTDRRHSGRNVGPESASGLPMPFFTPTPKFQATARQDHRHQQPAT